MMIHQQFSIIFVVIYSQNYRCFFFFSQLSALQSQKLSESTSPTLPLFPFNSSLGGSNNISTTDLHTLQFALQQQQQNLQQQLQNFLLLNSPTNSQSSSVLLQAQAQSAVLQASQQLRHLQQQQQQHHHHHQHQQQHKRTLNGTPKSSLTKHDYQVEDDDEPLSQKRPLLTNMSLALSSLQPIPLSNFSRSQMTAIPSIATTTTSSSSSSSPPTLSSPPPFTRFSPNSSNYSQQNSVGRLELQADENIDLEELDRFAKEFKQRRIKLGNCYQYITNKFTFLHHFYFSKICNDS